MPVLLGFLWALNMGCLLHCVRKGGNSNWLYILVLAPGIGSALYFVMVLLPEMRGTPGARRIEAGVLTALDPDKALRLKREAYADADTPQNAKDLAEELVERGNFAEARALYAGVMTGLYEFDAPLLIGRARAEFGMGDFAAAKASLELVQTHHPGFESRSGHLLYARVLEALGDTAKAAEEYEALVPVYPGPEAKARFAQLLTAAGDSARARLLYADTVKGHGRRREISFEDKAWVELARRALD
ncbi:MAG: hypothetical protein JNL07_04235 [Rhodospirillales bacterium]|nr:hypothetical protein [Rhodospirillales bacterium]